MKARFEIAGRLPGLNEIISANRSHFHAGRRQKKETQEICAQYILIGKVPVFTGAVRITFHWFEPNSRRDLDNISGGGSKFILDALVESGRLGNDSRKFVKEISHHFPEPDQANPRVVVEIENI